MKYIKDLKANEQVLIQGLVINITKGVGNNGVQYYSISLQDNTGVIEAKKWEIGPDDSEVYVVGNIVEVEASVVSYRDNLQLKILSGVALNLNEVDITRFEKSSPIPLDELKKRLDYYVNSIKDPECSLIVKTILTRYQDAFDVYPSAVRNHHEFTSGLIYHSVSMAALGEAIAKLYPDIDYDILMSAILLHDVGKIAELSGPVIPKYTLEGNLVGHISIMHALLKRTCEKLHIEGEVPLLLEHMILSHHGKREYGSPVEPLTKEAFLLNMIDDIDAKLIMLDKAYADTLPGEFTGKIFPMENRSFYKSLRKK